MIKKGVLSLLLMGLSCFLSLEVLAAANSLEGDGSVKVTGSERTDPVDPEKPGEPVDPGEGPSTEGPLRMDFISSLRFGEATITKSDRQYYALAQQFYDETEPRGSYVQITDQRGDVSGWSLQVKQTHQFTNPVIQNVAEQDLKGAVLSLDKGWANTNGTSQAPVVSRETIKLNEIDAAYDVAKAATGSGKGIWTIAFGASGTNEDNQENTLAPVLDDRGKSVSDELYKKPAYSNSAISLSVPDSTKIYPVQYQTELTWILAELP
ncbi:WxL domain-containing protein [Vagococcus sp. BWB3-3]|uniref:WxL domain-containing protein n=1 Tax=Vagococcus allomyrinae TaxID=2794353 RepID=A0A940P7T9_9ENTE|nr:WxL domain-containing protein [Vagococcus allomyrinae]MBP1040044.1 WxL domain-containing protein [Vagococcus allomyrinae]